MSFAYLKMPESLRPWYAAGLHFLFPASPENSGQEAPLQPESPPDQGHDAAGPPRLTLPPEIIDQLYAKACVPCQTLWTYWELGEDLLATPSKERRGILGALLRALGWPKGSITFWPVAIPVGGQTGEFARLFWQAANKIRPRMLVVFGEKAHKALVPETPYELFHCTGTGPVVLALPDILAVHPDKKESFYQTCDALRRARQTLR